MYEGEVIELSPEETENQMGGYGKVISHVIIGLKSVKGVKQLKLDPSIFDSLQKERVQVGLLARLAGPFLVCLMDIPFQCRFQLAHFWPFRIDLVA